ncbi:unnamed protein product [Calypogeia fissa]
MAASRIVALSSALSSSSSSVANFSGRTCLQSTGLLAHGCSWDGGERSMETVNLQVTASTRWGMTFRRDSRSKRTTQCFETSSSVGNSGRNSAVDKVLQAGRPPAAPEVVSDINLADSQHESNRFTEEMNEQHHEKFGSWNPELDPEQQQRERHPYEGVKILDTWREVQGKDNWDGMLDPLDDRVRSELIRYGEMSQATYDAFDNDEYSRFTGSCKYTKAEFFERSGLENRGYEMFEYVYSTSDVHIPKFFKTSSKVPENKKWSKASNWAGFVAYSNDEESKRLGRRDIVIAWRGTSTTFEWIRDVELTQSPTGEPPAVLFARNSLKLDPETEDLLANVKVESGFLSLYESRNIDSTHNRASARDQVLSAVQRLIEKFADEEMSITVTGHSLGAALATICAHDIAAWLKVLIDPSSSPLDGVSHAEPAGRQSNLPVKNYQGVLTRTSITLKAPPMVTAFPFGSPRVGNSAFKERLNQLGVKVLRLVNVHDVVPYVPSTLVFHGNLKFMWLNIPWLQNFLPVKVIRIVEEVFAATYTQVGVELKVDNLKSPFLKWSINPSIAHNLEVCLHLLTGVNGKNSCKFTSSLFATHLRDLALVNKFSAMLQEKFLIPENWFQEENKGLVRIRGHYSYRIVEHQDFPEQAFQQGPFLRKHAAPEKNSETKGQTVGDHVVDKTVIPKSGTQLA